MNITKGSSIHVMSNNFKYQSQWYSYNVLESILLLVIKSTKILILTLKPEPRPYKTNCWSRRKGWNLALSIGQMKINSKMAKMLNPYTNTFSFINKTYKHGNYNYSATIIYLCSILAGESVIKIPKEKKIKPFYYNL